MAASVTIVDDSEELRTLLSLFLRHQLGVDCHALASLAEVQSHADVVLRSRVAILDINLGPAQPDGVAILSWLRAHAFAGSVFFLTGHARNSPFVQRAAETGVRILEKPVPPKHLVSLLRNALGELEGRKRAGA